MYDSGRKLVITGIQHGKHPLTASQLRGQVFLRMYGGDFTVEEREKIARRIPNMELEADSEGVSQLRLFRGQTRWPKTRQESIEG